VPGPPARELGPPALPHVRHQDPRPSYGGCGLCQSLTLSPTSRKAGRAARSGPPPALLHEARDLTSYWLSEPAVQSRREMLDPSMLDGCVLLSQSRRAEGSLGIAGAARGYHRVSDSETPFRALRTPCPEGCGARQWPRPRHGVPFWCDAPTRKS
jgi:hypothetical protein